MKGRNHYLRPKVQVQHILCVLWLHIFNQAKMRKALPTEEIVSAEIEEIIDF